MLELTDLARRYGDGSSSAPRPGTRSWAARSSRSPPRPALIPLAARIYSGAVLRTGSAVKLREAWRAARA